MAVKEKEELLKKVLQSAEFDGKTELMEDISDTYDSIIQNAQSQVDFESDENPYKQQYNDILSKYRERFTKRETGEIKPPDTDYSYESLFKFKEED